MRENFLEKIEDPELQSLILPLYNFFEPFITKEPLPDSYRAEYLESNDRGDEDKGLSNEVEIKENITHPSKKSRKSIEETILIEYLELRVQEMESAQILNNVNQLLRYSMFMRFRTLQSFTASLSTNVNQFIKNKKNNMRTATKWRKVINSYISVSQILLNIEEIENVRNGNATDKDVILALGLVDYTDTQLKASVEIDRLMDLSKQTDKFIVVPVFGCTTNIFYSMLAEFRQSKILHVVGHGGIDNGREYTIQFSDANMRCRTFISKLRNFDMNLDIVFLNCCYSFEFSMEIQCSSQYINELITHSNEVRDDIAINFSDNYFTTLLTSNDFCKNGTYNDNKPIYDSAWSASSKNCIETPLQYIRR